MSDRPFNVLFLCTGNTARSVLAEGILRKDGAGRFSVFSAGSHPKGEINPFALKVLEGYGYPTDGFRSKSWDEFAAPERQRWISCSPSATAQRARPVLSGQDSR
jgi:arsenate reductase (thioredoxin)